MRRTADRRVADPVLGRLILAPCVSASRPARWGLGNELIPLAKAHLAARALEIPLVPPAWGFDRRPYWRHFSGSRLDVAPNLTAIAGRRRLEFTEAAYRQTGVVDYGLAARRWCSRHGSRWRRTVLVNEGLWGGFPAIDTARPFIRSYLGGSRYAPGNIAALRSRRRRGTILVGVHIRAGDFAPPSSGAVYRETWNVALPTAWYRDVCRGLRELLGDGVQFLVLGADAAGPGRALVDDLGALTTWSERHTDVSDLLLLSMADLLICSVSSFSLVAAWLSDAPYLWPSAQLHLDDGWQSIWGMESAQLSGLTASNRRQLSGLVDPPPGRGIPVPPSGRLPEAVSVALAPGDRAWDRRADLIYYGVVKESQIG